MGPDQKPVCGKPLFNECEEDGTSDDHGHWLA
jgi:hypothetical protein